MELFGVKHIFYLLTNVLGVYHDIFFFAENGFSFYMKRFETIKENIWRGYLYRLKGCTFFSYVCTYSHRALGVL